MARLSTPRAAMLAGDTAVWRRPPLRWMMRTPSPSRHAVPNPATAASRRRPASHELTPGIRAIAAAGTISVGRRRGTRPDRRREPIGACAAVQRTAERSAAVTFRAHPLPCPRLPLEVTLHRSVSRRPASQRSNVNVRHASLPATVRDAGIDDSAHKEGDGAPPDLSTCDAPQSMTTGRRRPGRPAHVPDESVGWSAPSHP